MSEVTLIDLASGKEAVIESIRGGRGMRYRLNSLGLREGTRLKKISRIGLGGPVVVEVERTQLALGRGMARRIIVRSIDGGQGVS